MAPLIKVALIHSICFSTKVVVVFYSKMSMNTDKMVSNFSLNQSKKIIQTCSLFSAGYVIFSKMLSTLVVLIQKYVLAKLATMPYINFYKTNKALVSY